LLTGLLFVPYIGVNAEQPAAKGHEVSETDGVPVLIKHLPGWESKRDSAVLASSVAELKNVLGDRPVLDAIDFRGGTEAVVAPYEEGKLLIVEFATPQGSAAADDIVKQRLVAGQQGGSVVYRRIGNYNAFVFDAADETSASSLLDQVKYEKKVQWLGENPFELRRMERAFIYMTRDMFIATVLWIILGMLGSILLGVGAGYLFFRFREKQRSRLTAFSDAGGLVRLNLDDLSEPILPE